MPLLLKVKYQDQSILAVSPRRTSLIDPRYRERLTVRSDWMEDGFFSQQIGVLKFVRATISTTVYVNRLNTSAPED